MTPFEDRIGYFITCAIPAHLLDDASDEHEGTSLRMDASTDGVSFIRVQRPLDAQCYLARVAASSEQVGASSGYTVLLSEDDLAFALPYDVRIQRQDPERVLEQLHSHAAAIRPATARPAARQVFEVDAAIGTFELPDELVQLPANAQPANEQAACLQAAMKAATALLALDRETSAHLCQRVARLEALAEYYHCHPGATVLHMLPVQRPAGAIWCVQFGRMAVVGRASVGRCCPLIEQ